MNGIVNIFENMIVINGHVHKMSMQGINFRNGHIPLMNTYHTFPSKTIFITIFFENIILINGNVHKMSMQGIYFRNGRIPQMNNNIHYYLF